MKKISGLNLRSHKSSYKLSFIHFMATLKFHIVPLGNYFLLHTDLRPVCALLRSMAASHVKNHLNAESAVPSDRATECMGAGCASCSHVTIRLAPPRPARPH